MMKSLSILIIAFGFLLYLWNSSMPLSEQENLFRAFIEEYNIGYSTNDEYNYRLEIFTNNLESYNILNQLNPYATFGITQFSDRTSEEFRKILMPVSDQGFSNINKTISPKVNVKDIDWSERLANVKYQGACSAGWTFAAIGAIEGRYHLTYKSKPKVDITYSEQHIIDCDRSSFGCIGGFLINAYNFLISSKGPIKESSYPFNTPPYTGVCKERYFKSEINVTSIVAIPSQNEDMLIDALQQGPVSVTIDATNWAGYKGGIITECGNNLNHAATLVGYFPNQSQTGVYKIRNSFSHMWGEKGYIRLSGSNICGIADNAIYPIVKDL